MQDKIDNLIMNYVISNAMPLSTVEDSAFLAMIAGLNPKANVIGTKKLKTMIENERKKFEEEVTAAMDSVINICLTADMWSTSHRGWLGITAHWLDEKTLLRKSVALCCKRIKGNHKQPNNVLEISLTLIIFSLGNHTYDLIASLIQEEMEKFKICNKVVCIVTDNGANIKKAVRSMQDCAQERENARRLARMEAAKNKRKEKAMKFGKPKAKKAKKASASRTSNHTSLRSRNTKLHIYILLFLYRKF